MVVNMNNPLAFPSIDYITQDGKENPKGMTLRDYFAAKAMPICYQYWMGDYYHPDCPDAEDRNSEGRDDFDQGNKNLIAEDAYKIADAMLKAREA
jgi:hypothetical protein